ncbi:helix-turn-helix domain-containing protein [Brevundimonas diminuta]|uniref:helix-turn-helix domain-containing protein n=1 Tax=Brevundimonas diminuta TaxID=293 RepID=UPI0012F7BE14|nr:helix-turn-helix transcriptional regulator [Brevundimonas diminuta]
MTDAEPVDEIDTYVGRRISDFREAASLSQERLAVLLGLDLPNLRAMESGQTKIFAGTLLTVSQALSVPVSALLPPEMH